MIAAANILFVSMLVLQCQHEDDPEPVPVTGVTRGTESLSCTNCTPLASNGASSDFNTSGVPSGVWYFDKSHSNVMWETAYKGAGSLLTGRFNYFVLTDVTLDEQNPAGMSFSGYVRLNSVNTGEAGRDGGCLLTTYGTAAAKTTEPENIATITSTGITYRESDAGYNFTANLTFHGVTKAVSGTLYYETQTHFDGSTPTNGYTIAGLEAEFEFLALTDFLVESTNIDDRVTVRINALMRKKD